MPATALDIDIRTLDELLPELDQSRVDRFVDVAQGDIIVRRPVTVPDKFQQLLCETFKFRLSWERRRPDLRDQTLSGYEMSLASIAANAGWSAQDICDLLVAFREKERGNGMAGATIAQPSARRLAKPPSIAAINDREPFTKKEKMTKVRTLPRRTKRPSS